MTPAGLTSPVARMKPAIGSHATPSSHHKRHLPPSFRPTTTARAPASPPPRHTPQAVGKHSPAACQSGHKERRKRAVHGEGKEARGVSRSMQSSHAAMSDTGRLLLPLRREASPLVWRSNTPVGLLNSFPHPFYFDPQRLQQPLCSHPPLPTTSATTAAATARVLQLPPPHPQPGSHLQLGGSSVEEARHPQVRHLEHAATPQQHVGGLDVAVHDAAAVQVLQPPRDLSRGARMRGERQGRGGIGRRAGIQTWPANLRRASSAGMQRQRGSPTPSKPPPRLQHARAEPRLACCR
jgi:hypothetical protein